MNAIKATVLSWFVTKEEPRSIKHCAVQSPKESNGERFRRAYSEGHLNESIKKAEIDYANGKALDRLY